MPFFLLYLCHSPANSMSLCLLPSLLLSSFYSSLISLMGMIRLPCYGSPVNSNVAGPGKLEAWHMSFLPKTAANSSQSPMVYSYSKAISGFPARLTEDEVEEMAQMDGFLKTQPDRTLPLLATHTPAFLRLQPSNGFWNGSGFGNGAIVGVLDTGIMHEHPSFNDDGMPLPPPRWKGECRSGYIFRCNNKLIGAKYFDRFGYKVPPIDHEGHGTHTASTAAGNFVPNADVLGNGHGTASGMARHAHLAIYQVCDCGVSNVLAGMDAVIKDGIHVISLSIAGEPAAFHQDPLAIATFAAATKGIFVSCAGGNSDPVSQTIVNGAPWVLKVAASTRDRNIWATVRPGNGTSSMGHLCSSQMHHFGPRAPKRQRRCIAR